MDLKGKYSGVVSLEFITQRDIKQNFYKMGLMGANCEYPEYHQSCIDANQVLSEEGEMRWDSTYLETNTTLDYKQYSKKGVHISPYIKKALISGALEKLVIWKWSPNNRAPNLNEGTPIAYEILGVVDAQDALDNLKIDDEGKSRFEYPIK